MSNKIPWSIRPEVYAPIEEKKVEVKEKPKSEKVYMLVLYYIDGTEDTVVEFVKGQATARELLKNCIDQIDIHASFVMVEDMPFGVPDGKPSVFTFLQWISDNYHDGFDIEDYEEHRREDEANEKEYMRLRDLGINGDEIQTYQNQQVEDMISIKNREVEELL